MHYATSSCNILIDYIIQELSSSNGNGSNRKAICDVIFNDSVARDLERDRGKIFRNLLITLDKSSIVVYNIYNGNGVLSLILIKFLFRLEKNTIRKTKLFLDHSSQDAKVVTAFVNFMLTIGLKSEDMIRTSVPSTKIPNTY